MPITGTWTCDKVVSYGSRENLELYYPIEKVGKMTISASGGTLHIVDTENFNLLQGKVDGLEFPVVQSIGPYETAISEWREVAVSAQNPYTGDVGTRELQVLLYVSNGKLTCVFIWREAGDISSSGIWD